MQKHKKYPELHVRSHPMRALAVFFAMITAFGMTGLGHEGNEERRRALGETVVPRIALSEALLEKENEAERMLVRYDEGIRNPTITGI